MERYRLKAAVEALLYVSETPLSVKKIRDSFDEEVDQADIREVVMSLVMEFESPGRGVRIAELAGGYQITTRPEFAPYVKKLQKIRPPKLSAQALETLAIIAYRQPIIKAEIEGIRGVSADGVLKTLLDRRLIRIAGRMDVPGKPMMYATTSEFLRYFGLRDLASLPSLRELERELGMEENSILSELEPELPGLDGPEMEAMAAEYRARRAAMLAEGEAEDEGAQDADVTSEKAAVMEGAAAADESVAEPTAAESSAATEDTASGDEPPDEPAADEGNWEDERPREAVCDPIPDDGEENIGEDTPERENTAENS